MNIEHLKLFVGIAKTSNISVAGREQNLSPAVSSTYISKLEDNLGVRLVHRTTRKVSLTEEGEAFLPHAEEILTNIETARASVGDGEHNPKGTLRVTAPASFGRMHIVPALAGFLARYPELSVDFRFNDSIVDLVEGGFDIAIRDAALKDSNLIARKLAPDRRIICAAPEYIKKFGEPSSPQDISKHQSVNLMGLDMWEFATPKGPLSVKANGRIRIDNGEAVRDAGIAGSGLVMSSIWCAYKALQQGELVQVLPDFPMVSKTAIWAVYPSNRLLAPKVRAFIDYFIEYYGQTPYWEQALKK
ncbi:LysR family transcriptional regulator [Paraglaciecola polaris]|uniref:Transcriptional regulator, LysR family n=1 Tax=Paraglaciecola polaris LMG 21857 TaxID=1129793 RepID=K6YLQ7_9ALTE|nr:LysR family transcriptional regulator [Paraglaciecola polaris]GAC33639.1 transcriptional regulator, LysR family [Paraglaciecola polaris LMG 21857]